MTSGTVTIPRLLMTATMAIGIVYAYAQLAGVAPEAFDAKAYWLASQADPYARSSVGQGYAYLYSPAFVQAFAPFQLLPWPLFSAIWTVLMVGMLVWAAGPWSLLLLVILPVLSAVTIGNIEFFLAAAIVAGFRRPATWAFVLLTKSSMGIGLVWFLVRRDWRALAWAGGATAVIVAVSFVVAPRLWFDWANVLMRNREATVPIWTLSGPLWLRVAVGAGITALGARTDRAWTVPVGAAIALPVAWGSLWAILAVGVVGVVRRQPGSVLARLERGHSAGQGSVEPRPSSAAAGAHS